MFSQPDSDRLVQAAIAPLLAAERHDPIHYAAALSMLGELAIAEGRFDEAIPYLDRALELRPVLNVTPMLRGMNRLRLGQFHLGSADYAVREAIPRLHPNGLPKLADQARSGEVLTGKTLLLIDDQGYGDAIQFVRYLPLLRHRGAVHITWRTFSTPPAEMFLTLADVPGISVHSLQHQVGAGDLPALPPAPPSGALSKRPPTSRTPQQSLQA